MGRLKNRVSDEFILYMVDQGYTTKEISEHVKVSERLVQRVKQSHRPKNTDRRLHSDHRMALYLDGYSDSEIAEIIDVDISTIRVWRNRRNLTPNARKVPLKPWLPVKKPVVQTKTDPTRIEPITPRITIDPKGHMRLEKVICVRNNRVVSGKIVGKVYNTITLATDDGEREMINCKLFNKSSIERIFNYCKQQKFRDYTEKLQFNVARSSKNDPYYYNP